MEGTLQVAVVTPSAELLRMEVKSVSVPTQDGEITVLPGHASYLANLGMGTLTLQGEGVRAEVFVAEGFVEASAQRVVVLAERADYVTALDAERAKASLADAVAKLAKCLPGSPEHALQDKRRRRAEARLAAVAQQEQ